METSQQMTSKWMGMVRRREFFACRFALLALLCAGPAACGAGAAVEPPPAPAPDEPAAPTPDLAAPATDPSYGWAPEPLLPADGAMLTDARPLFSWQLQNRPDEVLVQICGDSECANVAQELTSDDATSVRPATDLMPGLYYWRAARTAGGSRTSIWSALRFFTIALPTKITADLFGVYSVSETDVWAVGAAGTIAHYGGSWSTETSPTSQELRAVWAAPGGQAFAVGGGGVILRRSSNTWTAMKSPTTETLYGVWGSAANAVWAVGNNGLILRYDGASWTIAHNRMAGTLRGVWGSGKSDVWAVGSGKEPDGDYAALLLHWDGTRWTESYVCNPEGTRFASGGWVATLTDVFGVGGSIYAAGQCQSGASFIPYGYVAQKDGGGAWHDTPGFGFGLPEGKFRPLQTIWGSSTSDVWAASASEMVGGASSPPTMLHWNGSSWTASTQAITVGIADLGGTCASDIWAVGKGGKRLHYDGTSWTAAP